MTQPPLPVLFAHFGEDWIRGSETVLLDLLAHIDRSRIAPVVWCNGAEMAEACRAAGVPTYRSRFEHYFGYGSPRFSPRHYLSLVAEAMRLIRRHDIRVLHANSAAPAQWLVPAGALLRRPLLVHLHIDYLRRNRYVSLLHAADRVVGVSRHTVEGLLADGMPAARVRVVHNGIDPGRVAPSATDLRARLGIAPEAVVVASVGSLVRRKGHDLLLRSLAALPPTDPAPHLVIGGDGEAQAELAALAGALGIAARVHFLGYTGDPGAIYGMADIFALASRQDACPLVLAEAGYCGLPAVATRVGGIPEVIADGETGLILPPEDVGALTAALGRLAADPAERRRLGAAARRRVESLFTVPRMAAGFERLYAELAQPAMRQPASSRLAPYVRLVGFGRAGP